MISDFKIITRHKKDYLFVQEKFNANEKFENSCAIDKVRYNYFFEKRLANKQYQNYCATYSWLRQSILATRKLIKPKNLNKVQIPIIIFQAENDTVVKSNGQNKFAQGVKNSLLIFVPESKHEIFMAQSKIITPYLQKIFEFID